MAFLDTLGKKVTEVGQKTIQKTKDFSDTSRLSGLISDERKKIDNNYFRIGKLYAAMHRADCEEEFVGMLNGIVESEAKIAELQKQIQDIKGVQHCEKCGAEVPRGAGFCSVCGASMPRQEESLTADTVMCKNCGTAVEKGMRFCTVCGKPMEQAEMVGKTAEGKMMTQERVCPSCGAQITEESLFCTECGTRI